MKRIYFKDGKHEGLVIEAPEDAKFVELTDGQWYKSTGSADVKGREIWVATNERPPKHPNG